MTKTMFRWIVWLMLLMSASGAWAVTVSGKIHDRETGESIPGVAVMVQGTPRGAAANVEGFFSLPELPAGPVTLTLRALGYRSLTKALTLSEGEDQHLTLRMIPEAVQLTEVIIEAENPGEREYTPQVAQYSLETRELAKLPQLAEADLFRSLQFMPGVLPSSDFSSELNIWGGSSDQNLILLNGIEVYKPTHMGGIFSVFNMDAVKDVKLIKGGFPAKYGGRLSAVVDVADREGNRNETQGKVGISFLSSHATLEGPLPRGSWLIAGRRTYVDAATKLLKDAGAISDDFPYYFYDLNVKLTRDFPNGDRLTPSAYHGRDKLDIVSSTDDRIRMGWGNATYSVPFVHIWHHKLFSITTVAGSYFDASFRFETADQWSNFWNSISDFTMKTDWTYFANARHTFDYGIMAKQLDLNLKIDSNTETYYDNEFKGWQLAGYLSDDFRPTETITITPGLRVEHNTLSKYTDLLPRLSLKKELSEHSWISAAGGLYAQPLQQVTFGEGFASIFNSYILLDKSFLSNRAWHSAITYQHDLAGPFKITAGTFVKEFHHIVEYNPNQVVEESDRLSDLFSEGDGYAYGADVLVQGEVDKYSVMGGYGLGRSKRETDFWDNGLDYPAHFDRLHNANVLVSRKVGRRGSLEVRFNYGTGQPLTKAEGAYSFGLDLPPQFYEPGRKNGHRLPAYHRLDLAYRVKFDYRTWSVTPYVEVINVYNRKNVLAYEYDLKTNPVTIKQIGQIPILPSIGFTAEF